MTCARCGGEAAVKRDNAFYCAKCAMARDWEEVIAIVQEERVDMGASIEFGSGSTTPAAQTPTPQPAKIPAATPAAAPVPPPAAPSNNGDLPADPFS
jgi:hypothetical protein